MNNPSDAFLNGRQVYLRKLQVSDASDDYCRWLNDPEVNRYLETRFEANTIESIRKFIELQSGSGSNHLFAICDAEGQRHIGNIKLGPVNWIHQHAQISLFIGNKTYWGRGIASEAIALVVSFAFRSLSLRKLQAGAYAANKGSINAFLKNGFVQEGLIREMFISDMQAMDMIWLGLTKSDYLSQINQLSPAG